MVVAMGSFLLSGEICSGFLQGRYQCGTGNYLSGSTGPKNRKMLNKDFILFLYYIIMATLTHTQFQEETDTLTLTEGYCSLIVWNDDLNTFDWVIQTLIEICGHSAEQAEQCAILIDSKGKYAVKEGKYDILKPPCDAITERGIGATIEVIAN